MHRTTVSPSSSSTRRRTPCVAGCCGPMLMSMCSASSSGSIAGIGSTATAESPPATRGTRCGRPWASMPVVESSTSSVRLVLLTGLLTARDPGAHVQRELFECVGDGQLLHRVARFRVRGERLPELFRAAETAAEGGGLSQRISFLELLPHEDPPEVGMPGETDAEHVVAFALEPVRALVDGPDAGHFERCALRNERLQAEKTAELERAHVPDDLDGHRDIAMLHRRHVREILVALRRVIVQPAHDLEHALGVDDDVRLAPSDIDSRYGPRRTST